MIGSTLPFSERSLVPGHIDSWLKDLTDEDFTNAVKECVKVVNYFLGSQKESEKKQEVEIKCTPCLDNNFTF